MADSATHRDHSGFSVLGVGIAACLACCAPLVLGFLGGLGLAGVALALVIGVAGLVLTAIALAAFLLYRRRVASCRAPARDC
jgi:glycerol-3-phosphate acyltransferase PlsY